MESKRPTDEIEESQRIDCALAGGAGGMLGAFLTLIIAHVPEISWHIVHGWSRPVPWFVDSDWVFRFGLGIIVGVAFGLAQKRRPRFAFWMGAGISFLVCFTIAPGPFRFRE